MSSSKLTDLCIKWIGMNSMVPEVCQRNARGTGHIRLTKLSVDPSYQFVHHGSEVLIFFDVLSARNRHLDQHNFSNPFRMVSQEDFESVELLGNAFYVIKAINSDH